MRGFLRKWSDFCKDFEKNESLLAGRILSIAASKKRDSHPFFLASFPDGAIARKRGIAYNEKARCLEG
jgi:hypothetical protein